MPAKDVGKPMGAVIQVKVLPRSSKTEIVGQTDGVYRIKLTAPPVDGKANKTLINFLAKKTGLPKGKIQIVSGEHSRNKTIRIHTASPLAAIKHLGED
ncbi:MAG: YggU family protein [Deltaproteobacteria bacterium]|nr:YggU family protein [Deltaproteobacteria bacterium]